MYANSLHRSIYKLYFFCLPLGHFLNLPFNDLIHAYIPDFSTVLALFGLIILSLFNKSVMYENRVGGLFKLYAIFVLYSILAALALSFYLRNPIESPFRAIIGDIVLFLLFVLTVYYNSIILTKYVSIKSLFPIMKFQAIILLLVGFLQLFSMKGFSFASIIYNSLSTIFSFRDLNWLSNVERGVTFFGPEPSSASLICYLTIPYVLVMIFTSKRKDRLTYIVLLTLFAYLFFQSDSSSAQISFIYVIFSAIILCILKSKNSLLRLCSFLIGLSMAIMYTIVFAGDAINVDFNSDLQYVLWGKFFDTSNYSTITRSSTVINDMLIFKDFPITGVGNGNQGFFFNQNVPSWMNRSVEVEGFRSVITNGGGNFFPSFVSAFGLLGVIILISFIKKYKKWEEDSVVRESREVWLLYNMTISLFLLTSWYSVSLKSFEIMAFIFSLPFVRREFNNKSNIQ